MKYYYMCEEANNPYIRAALQTHNKDEHALLRAKRKPPGEVRYAVVEGWKPQPILDCGVWSKELIKVMRSINATGFDTFDIGVYKATGEPIEGYFGVRVTGRGGEFDEERSGAQRSGRGVLLHYQAIHMNESQWDGSDVFLIPNLGSMVFVTERVAEAIRESKLRPIDLDLNTECMN